jgi:hypothetical protein
MVSGVDSREGDQLRPSLIEVTAGSQTYEWPDLLGAETDGWTSLTLPVQVPAGVDSLQVRLLSEDRTGTGLTPVSFVWIMAGLDVPGADASLGHATAAPHRVDAP